MSLKASRTKSLSLGDDLPTKNNNNGQNPLLAAAINTSKDGTRAGVGIGGVKQPTSAEDTGKIMKLIDDNIIGKGAVFLGPFGRRKGM